MFVRLCVCETVLVCVCETVLVFLNFEFCLEECVKNCVLWSVTIVG